MADVFRKAYRDLSATEKGKIDAIKDKASALMAELQQDESNLGADSRCLALARTKLEEVVFWGTKAVTA